MTTYSAIASGDIDPESPLTTTLLTKLRDNPIAIAEGASGAPTMTTAAMPVDEINGSLAGLTLGDVGSYAFLGSSAFNVSFTEGATYAGSSLRYAGVHSGAAISGTPSGTWRALGGITGIINFYSVTLFIRIS